MAGFLSNLFGGRDAAAAAADPVPGIGGYTEPKGPAGETGYPGSTGATRINPRGSWTRRSVHGARGPQGTIEQEQAGRQDQPGVFHGGLPRETSGYSLEPGLVNPQDTEQRVHIGASLYVPGGQRQRNSTYYGGLKAIPDGENRYGFNLPGGGGVERYAMDRRMPYTGRGNGARGADLNGERFYGDPPVMSSQNGAYGDVRLSKRHRPTVFSEPAPWSANYYDTTEATGAPDAPGNAAQVQAVYVSPEVPRSTGWRRGG